MRLNNTIITFIFIAMNLDTARCAQFVAACSHVIARQALHAAILVPHPAHSASKYEPLTFHSYALLSRSISIRKVTKVEDLE